MSKFTTAHGGLRTAFGIADPRDPNQCRIVSEKRRFLLESPFGVHDRNRTGGWSGRVCSLGKKGAEARKVDSGVGSLKGGGPVDEEGYERFETDELSCFKGLVLDISYRPVNVVCWKRAICLEFMEKVPHLLQVMKRRRIKCTLSRKSIFYRDNYTCQYCSSHENLTIDHVLPVSRGGEWKWENLVSACSRCNTKKGHKTVEEANMKLIKTPKAPKDYDILAIPLTNAAVRALKMRKGIPEEWLQYLSKPSP